jgi:predicted ArsR family transcriptional regulator
MATVKGGSLAARILMLLGERYPITLRQVALALQTRPDQVEREAKRLLTQGLVVTEKLGDETYVALSGAGITYLGLPAKDAERLRNRRPAPAKPRDESDPAFG